MDVVERRGAGDEVRVRGIERSNGDNLARAQAHAAIDHPDQAVGTGRLAQGQALERTGRCDPDEAESPAPIDDGVRAWRFLDAKSPSQQTQDARDGAKAETRHAKEVQGQEDHVHLGQGDKLLRLALELTQTRLGRFEGCGGAGALSRDANALLALVALSIASLRGLVFPLISTVGDLRELTPHVRAPTPMAAGSQGRRGLR